MNKTHPLYPVWISMRGRCNNKRDPQWKDYGGRGIKVCDRWSLRLDGFQNFVADMGPRPPGLSIDRRDNNGDYEPGNCRWATRREQQLNRRKTVRLVIDGRAYLMADLALQSGLKADTVRARVDAGLSLAEVLDKKRRVHRAGLALGGHASGAKKRAKTHCKAGHPFDAANTLQTPEGWRACRACHAARQAARRLSRYGA